MAENEKRGEKKQNMLTESQQNALTTLDRKILDCKKCELCNNGHTIPYWTEKSRYMAVLEAPGEEEVKQMTPTVGKAGKFLWEFMKQRELNKEDFSILNTVQCRPVKKNGSKVTNGKPTLEQIKLCSVWLTWYIRVLRPEKLIAFGVYAIQALLNDQRPMKEMNGEITKETLFGHKVKVVKAVHPAWASIYNREKGDILLSEAIQKFNLI
jgi:uracil-DNA glycosylase family 4